jgi:integrase
MRLPKKGAVIDGGIEVDYPQGRFEIRQYNSDRKPVYTPVDSDIPNVAMVQVQVAQKRLLVRHGKIDELRVLKKAAAAYVKNCKARQAMEAAAQAKLVLDEFLPLVNVTYVRGITREDILKFHAVLRKRGLKDRTVANKHNRLKAFLRFAGGDLSIVGKTPKYEKGLPTIYASAETSEILAAADDYMELVIELGLKLGLREQEITYAEWGDVNWDESVFRVQGKAHWGWKIKDNEMREIPISADVLEHLKARRKEFPKTKLIVGTSSDRPNQHFLRTLKRLARRAGLNCGKCHGCGTESQECENWTLHKLRRTFCTTLLRNGVDARTVSAWAGHADLATTLRYLRPASAKEMQDRVNAIPW